MTQTEHLFYKKHNFEEVCTLGLVEFTPLELKAGGYGQFILAGVDSSMKTALLLLGLVKCSDIFLSYDIYRGVIQNVHAMEFLMIVAFRHYL